MKTRKEKKLTCSITVNLEVANIWIKNKIENVLTIF